MGRLTLLALVVVLIPFLALFFAFDNTKTPPVYRDFKQIELATVDVVVYYWFSLSPNLEGISRKSFRYGQGLAVGNRLVLTCKHIIELPRFAVMYGIKSRIYVQKTEIKVFDPGRGTWVGGEIKWVNPKADLVLISLNNNVHPYWKGVNEAKIGETVYVACSWFLKNLLLIPTEVVAQKLYFMRPSLEESEIDLNGDSEEAPIINLSIERGWSGTPVFNRAGELVGLIRGSFNNVAFLQKIDTLTLVQIARLNARPN